MNIYCSSRTANQATIQFQASSVAELDSVDETNSAGEISGSVRGPFCQFSRTLPCTTPIKNGCAVVVDPCYWTPRLPFQYEVKLKFSGPAGTLEEEFLWGIRCCLPYKNGFRIDGKGVVIRAVQPARHKIDIAALREHSAALLTHHRLAPTIYEEASQLGVMIIDTDTVSEQQYSTLNRHASVHFLRALKQQSDVISVFSYPSKSEPTNGVELVDDTSVTSSLPKASRPTFVERKVAAAPLADMRKSCDALQRDLAGYGQFAGYLISLEAGK